MYLANLPPERVRSCVITCMQNIAACIPLMSHVHAC